MSMSLSFINGDDYCISLDIVASVPSLLEHFLNLGERLLSHG